MHMEAQTCIYGAKQLYLGNWERKDSKEGEWEKEKGSGVNKYKMILALDGH